jgi:1-acyl-sn-glycerol-3-phosphate acyltransferase
LFCTLIEITMGDAIDFAIEQAEKVPELEKKIKELQEEVDNLNSATMARELQGEREY